MYFPDLKGESRPWIKLDGQAGEFKVSMPEGEEQVIDTEGLEIGLDLYNAKQGWLAFINRASERPISVIMLNAGLTHCYH